MKRKYIYFISILVVVILGFGVGIPTRNQTEDIHAKNTLFRYLCKQNDIVDTRNNYKQPVYAIDKTTSDILIRNKIQIISNANHMYKAAFNLKHSSNGYKVKWTYDGPDDVYESGTYEILYWFGIEFTYNHIRSMA